MNRTALKSNLINSAIVLAVLLLFLAGGEFFARAYVPESIRMTREAYSYFNMMDYDEEIGGRVLKKNYDGTVFFRFGDDFRVKTNSLGLRNPEIKEKGDNLRVLFVGDSFTMGYGVNQNESFPDYLRSLFAEKTWGSRKVEIVNGGITGWGTPQISNFIHRDLSTINPDVVIYALYINDIYDTYRSTTHTSRDTFLENWKRQRKEIEDYMAERSFIHAAHFFLSNTSYFYEFLTGRIRGTMERWDETRLAWNKWQSVGKIGVHNYQPWSAGSQGAAVIDHSKTVTASMNIHSWKIMSLADSDELSLLVWRYDESAKTWNVVGKSSPQQASFGMNSFAIEPPVEARKGDVVGFFTKSGSIARLHPLDNMARTYRNGSHEDNSVPFISDGSGNYCMRVDGPLLNPPSSDTPAETTTPIPIESQVTSVPVETLSAEADISKGEMELLKTHYNAATYAAYQKTLQLIGEMNNQVQGTGSKFYVVNIPSYLEIGKYLPDTAHDAQMRLKEKYQPAHFDERLESDLKAMGINFVSIKDAVARSPQSDLYLSDSHLNSTGHQVVAQALYEAFQPNLLQMLSKK